MNLSDMLGLADIQQLGRIADVYRCECNGNSKNELIQSILSTVSRNDVFEAQVSSMSLEDLRFLNSLLFEPQGSYSLEDLIARVQQSRFGSTPVHNAAVAPAKNRRVKKNAMPAPPPSPREMIVKFKHQGWLFNGISGPGRYLFQVPADLKTRFRDALARRFATELVYAEEPPFYRDEQTLMEGDVTCLLHYIYHHEVQLTADGSMYKRFILQLMGLLGVQEELPAKGEWRFGYGKHFNHYPNRLSLLYDYCSANRYIAENQSQLTLTAAGEARLAAAPQGENASLYRYWLKAYKGPIVNLLSLVHWIDSLAANWVTVASLRTALVPYIKPYYYDSADTILDTRIIAMMVHLGLLRLGEHPDSRAVVRMTKAGHAIISGTLHGEPKSPRTQHL